MASNKVDDSSPDVPMGLAPALGLVPNPGRMQWRKVLPLVAVVLGILGTVVAAPLWVVKQVRAEAALVKADVKESIATHAANPHSSAVPREVYITHVADAAQRDDDRKAWQLRMDDRVDALGEKAYRTPAKWKHRVAPEAPAAPQ